MTMRAALLLSARALALCPVYYETAEESVIPVPGRVEMWLDLYTGEPVE